MSDKRRRADDVLLFICQYADENCGVTPPQRVIAKSLKLSTPRVQYLMARLEADGFIRYVDKTYSYKVINSLWEPPPYVEISRH